MALDIDCAREGYRFDPIVVSEVASKLINKAAAVLGWELLKEWLT